VLYAVAIATGFRQRALLSLSKQSFFVATDLNKPFIRSAAKANKNRRDRDQRISPELAAMLRQWLQGKPDQGLVWRPLPHADLVLRFRRDLEYARQTWIAEAAMPDEREQRERSGLLKYVEFVGAKNVYVDFHALRHTAIILVVRKAGIWVGQAWADYSTPLLTARYAEPGADDLSTAVAAMPRLDTALKAAGVCARRKGASSHTPRRARRKVAQAPCKRAGPLIREKSGKIWRPERVGKEIKKQKLSGRITAV
jgi:hypothetical protein